MDEDLLKNFSIVRFCKTKYLQRFWKDDVEKVHGFFYHTLILLVYIEILLRLKYLVVSQNSGSAIVIKSIRKDIFRKRNLKYFITKILGENL